MLVGFRRALSPSHFSFGSNNCHVTSSSLSPYRYQQLHFIDSFYEKKKISFLKFKQKYSCNLQVFLLISVWCLEWLLKRKKKNPFGNLWIIFPSPPLFNRKATFYLVRWPCTSRPLPKQCFNDTTVIFLHVDPSEKAENHVLEVFPGGAVYITSF